MLYTLILYTRQIEVTSNLSDANRKITEETRTKVFCFKIQHISYQASVFQNVPLSINRCHLKVEFWSQISLGNSTLTKVKETFNACYESPSGELQHAEFSKHIRRQTTFYSSCQNSSQDSCLLDQSLGNPSLSINTSYRKKTF